MPDITFFATTPIKEEDGITRYRYQKILGLSVEHGFDPTQDALWHAMCEVRIEHPDCVGAIYRSGGIRVAAGGAGFLGALDRQQLVR